MVSAPAANFASLTFAEKLGYRLPTPFNLDFEVPAPLFLQSARRVSDAVASWGEPLQRRATSADSFPKSNLCARDSAPLTAHRRGFRATFATALIFFDEARGVLDPTTGLAKLRPPTLRPPGRKRFRFYAENFRRLSLGHALVLGIKSAGSRVVHRGQTRLIEFDGSRSP